MKVLKEVTFELGLKHGHSLATGSAVHFSSYPLNKVFLPVELLVMTCVPFLLLYNPFPQIG